jgi:putative PEP-CTERM system TPR-repeat lipoprotein
MDKGAYPRSEVGFNKARDLTPTDPQLHVYLAVLALRSGDVLKAEARAINASWIAPESADVWNVQGDVLHMQGKLEAASEVYSKALLASSEHYDARLSRAGILTDLGQFAKAAADVEELRERGPLDPRPVYLQSVLLTNAKKSAAAREALKRAAALLDEIGPAALERSMQLVLLAGLANFELGDLEQAQGYLARYVERYPLQPAPCKLLGAVMLRKGRSTEAIITMEPALAKAPNDYKLLSLLGAAYMQNGRYDIATRYLETALKLSRSNPEVRARLAMSRIGGGFEEQGLADLSALFNEDPQTHKFIGLILASLEPKRGGFARAVEVALTMLESDPDNTTLLNLLGAAQMSLGRSDAARFAFEKALALDNTFLLARIILGKLEAVFGNLSAARQMFNEAVEARPGSEAAMLELGKLERRVGRAGDGLRWLQKPQVTAPNSVPVGLALVGLHLSTRDVAEAIRVAREVESREPENMDLLATLARTHQVGRREDQALDVFKQMARIAGFDAKVLYRAARLQLRARARGDAMYSLDKALKGDATHPPSRLLLIELQIHSGKVQ